MEPPVLSVRSPRAPARCSARGTRSRTILRLPLRNPSLAVAFNACRSQRIDRLCTRHRSARHGLPGGSAGTDLPRRLCDVGGYPQYPFSQPGGDSNGAIRATIPVAPGDSLWSIAASLRSDGDDARIDATWRAIHTANAESVRDPALIYPGQTLAIPQDLP